MFLIYIPLKLNTKKLVKKLFLSSHFEQIVQTYDEQCADIAKHYQLQEAIQIVLLHGQENVSPSLVPPSPSHSDKTQLKNVAGRPVNDQHDIQLTLSVLKQRVQAKIVEQESEIPSVSDVDDSFTRQLEEFLLLDTEKIEALVSACSGQTFFQRLAALYKQENELHDQIATFLQPLTAQSAIASKQLMCNRLLVERAQTPLRQLVFFPHIRDALNQLVQAIYGFSDGVYFVSYLHPWLQRGYTQAMLLDQIKADQAQTVQLVVQETILLLEQLFPKEMIGRPQRTIHGVLDVLTELLGSEITLNAEHCALINSAYTVPSLLLDIDGYIPHVEILPIISMTSQLLNAFHIQQHTNSAEVFVAQIQKLLALLSPPKPYLQLVDVIKAKQSRPQFMQFATYANQLDSKVTGQLEAAIGELVFNESYGTFEDLKEDFDNFRLYCFDVQIPLKNSPIQKHLKELSDFALQPHCLDNAYVLLFRHLLELNARWPEIDFLLQFVVGVEDKEIHE